MRRLEILYKECEGTRSSKPASRRRSGRSSRFSHRLPLAWLQLIREKTRFAIALSGIAFASVLIFVQLGFEDALYDGCMLPHQALNADLVMINPQFQTFFSPKSFSRSNLYRCRGLDGVDAVTGVYLGRGEFKNPENGMNRDLLVYGCDPTTVPFKQDGLAEQMPKLRMLDRAFFDTGSRPEFGPVKSMLGESKQIHTEVNRKGVSICGKFLLGASFTSDGNLLTSDSTFLRFFPEHRSDQVELGLIRLRPGADVEEVKAAIRSRLEAGAPRFAANARFGKPVLVLNKKEFAQREKEYWANNTGIGYVFGFGVIVGFVVGVVIVYQVLYSDVCDHLAEYATLKAIGYTNRYLVWVLLQEAFILSICGYIPGLLLSFILYKVSSDATLLPIAMSFDRAAFVLVLSLLMCSMSALIAMRKLRDADPADIF